MPRVALRRSSLPIFAFERSDEFGRAEWFSMPAGFDSESARTLPVDR